MMFRKIAAFLASTLVLLLATGCGGGADRTKAQVRLVNASTGYEALELRVDDQLRQGGVAYGGSADYVEATPGKPFTVTTPSSPTSLLSFTPSVSARNHYTVLSYGPAGALKQVLLDDNNGQPDDNRTLVRVLNGAPDAGPLDVYITASGDSLDSSVAVQSSAAVGTVNSYFTVNSGTWRLRVTVPGGKAASDLRLDSPALVLGSREVVTLVLVPGPGGVLVKALALKQQGGIDVKAATQARVRVATGLPNVAVGVTGGSTLLAASPLPVVTQYTNVSSGTPSLSITVGGSAVTPPAITLAPGGDYTLVVYGSSAAPLVAALTDLNTLPSDSTKAKVRLVNGTDSGSGALTMTIDGAPLTETAAVGAATGYATQVPTTTAGVAVAGNGLTGTISFTDRIFAAGNIYSVFVLGPSTGATGIFRQDR